MADLTSLHKNKPKRDFSIQACADCINKIAIRYPNEFKEGFFTDYFDIAGGTQPPKSTFINEAKDGYIKFLQIRDFSSDSTPTYIPISKNNKICSEKDLVLGRYGASVGKILTGKAGAYNVACAKIIFLEEDNFDREFLFYWLHSSYFQNFLTSISRSAQGGFNKNDLSRIRTQFPNVGIQRKLTSIMKEIDLALLNGDKITFEKRGKTEIEIAFIELLEKFLSFINEGEELSTELTHQLTLVKKLRQQLLQDAVQGKLVEQNKKDEPASVLLKKIKAEKEKLIAEKKLKKEKELPPIKPEEIPFEIPENWVWCRLGGVSLFSEAGSSFKCEEVPVSNNEWGVIKVSAVSWDVFLEDKNKVYSKTQPSDISAKINVGDFLISRANTSELVGKSVVVKSISKNLLLSDKTIRFKFSNFASTDYIHLCNNYTKYARDYYTLMGTGSSPSMKNITRQHMKNLIIPLPPFAEQNRIVQKLDELMQYCNELETSIKESQQQNEKLLKQVLREALQPAKAVKVNTPVFSNKELLAFYQKQILAHIIQKHHTAKMPQGEVVIAKDTYHLEKFYGIKTFFNFQNRGYGTYDPKINELLNGDDKLFKLQNIGEKGYKVLSLGENAPSLFNDTTYKEEFEKINNAMDELLSVYSQFPAQKRTRKIELLNTVSKVISDTQSLEMNSIRKAMTEWKTPKTGFKNKAKKFTLQETKECLSLILKKNWDKKLLN